MPEEAIIRELTQQAEKTLDAAVEALQQAGRIPAGGVIVLGCSTSEVAGGRIGHQSVPAFGEVIAAAMLRACERRQLQAAFQCCEHLNRSLVIEEAAALALRLTQVCAIPQPKAGGSVPAAAWQLLRRPVLVEAIRADAAIDIGDTLVGMHIRPVAVPLRLDDDRLGEARVIAAYSRLPLIGGRRAVYPD